jgi:glycosyltransferase involved in cell wall biosynthesis
VAPLISVAIPARNESLSSLLATVRSAYEQSMEPEAIEVVVVDDGSQSAVSAAAFARAIRPRVVASRRRLGVGQARNLAVRSSRGEIAFITDAHVTFSPGWDREATRLLAPDRVLATVVTEQDSTWRAYGCRLVTPWMGTRWKTASAPELTPVEVASSAGTVLERSLFERIGGYDEGMLEYGGYEPEFSLRAWRHGAHIALAPDIEVAHRFKGRREARAVLDGAREALVHNCLRFAVAHMPENRILETVRLHAVEFPQHVAGALRMLERRGAWERRAYLESRLQHDFEWFARRFALEVYQ